MKRKRPIGLILLVSIFILASFFVVFIFAKNWLVAFSDHTDLEGEIIAERRSLHVDDVITLELTLPDRLDGVYRIHWEVEPENAGTVEYTPVGYDDAVVDEDGNRIYPKHDRKAYFIADKPGRCAVNVFGFYKQTNPQFITKIELAITP